MSASSIQTAANLAALPIRAILAAMPILVNWRNSKGRVTPLHLKSAPGTGKNMLADAAVRCIARQNPGVPVGQGIVNPGVMNPTDAAGFVLFDTVDGQKTSVYTRPTLFAVRYALIYVGLDADGQPVADNVDSEGFIRVTRDDAGQPLYVGSNVHGQKLVKGITIFDEFDQGDIEVRKVLAPVLDEGRITNHTLPEDWIVWCASNRAKDASGVGRGLAFLTNRVCNIELLPDMDMLSDFFSGIDATHLVEPVTPTRIPNVGAGRMVRDPGNVDSRAHPALMAYARQNEDTLFAGVPSDPNMPFLTPRSLEAISNLFDITLRLDVADESGAMAESASFADSFIGRGDGPIDGLSGTSAERWSLFTALAAGTIGGDNTAQFLATLELFDEVPTLAEIIKDPAKVKVSDKRDAQFIIGYQIANGMTVKNANALMAYASRLDTPIYHNVAHNAASRDGMLLTANAVAQFFTDNPDSLVRMMMMKRHAQAPGRKV